MTVNKRQTDLASYMLLQDIQRLKGEETAISESPLFPHKVSENQEKNNKKCTFITVYHRIKVLIASPLIIAHLCLLKR